MSILTQSRRTVQTPCISYALELDYKRTSHVLCKMSGFVLLLAIFNEGAYLSFK